MAKDKLWFPHDHNARSDLKMIALRSKFGWEGYGRYWALIEILRSEDCYQLSMNELHHYALAKELEMERKDLEEFVEFCWNIELIDITKSEDITLIRSTALIKRMKPYDIRKHNAKKAAAIRWGGDDDDEDEVGDFKIPISRKDSTIVRVQPMKEEDEYDFETPVHFLNQMTGKNFSKKIEVTKGLLRARYKEGRTLDQMKLVITNRCEKWENDPKMKEYLRPKTLFNATNFEQYLAEAERDDITSADKSGELAEYFNGA